MNRYPGIRPFRSDERHLFFGRTDDTERLLRLILLEKIVILYGKSGYGKSSLLQAGVCPRLLESGELPFRELRLGPHKPGESLPPVQTLLSAVAFLPAGASQAGAKADSGLQTLFTHDNSFWLALKKRQIATGAARFLLVFDQFEELFTYPAEQIIDFKRQLAEALYSLVPDRYGRAIAKNPGALSIEEQTAFFAPLELKVVFSIRADRMSQLNTLKDYLPNLLQHAYLLDALDENQATEAVVEPAAMSDPTPDGRGAVESTVSATPLPSGVGSRPGSGAGVFDTPPFSYTPAALSLIFKELRDSDTGKIETSALQIVCKHVEDNIVAPRTSLTTFDMLPNLVIRPDDLGDIKSIFRQFYDRSIAGLAEADRPVARHVVEDLLIKDGVRLPFAAQALLAEPGVTDGLLQKLTEVSLLRVERDEQGRMIYEVGHDTLVGPIEEAAKARREEEARTEERERLRREAEAQRIESLKIQRARRRNVAFSVAALLLLAWALWQTAQARRQKALADERTAAALAAERRAVEKDSIAGAAQIRADTARAIAARQTDLARRNAEATAQAMLQLGHSTEQVVDALVKEANGHIYRLEYPDALGKLEAAARFHKRTPDFVHAALELAFYYNETRTSGSEGVTSSHPLTDDGDLVQALTLLGRPSERVTSGSERVTGSHPLTQQQLRDYLRRTDPPWYKTLMEKYYPVMLPIPGGEYPPGCVKPGDCGITDSSYRVRLNDFRLARTETTFYQYGLFCAALGRNTQRLHSPNWGLAGDNPVVNVHWYNAAEYANWLSVQFGLQPAYSIDSLQRDTNSLSDYDDLKWTVRLVPDANGFRLPSEAEWEWAARGGARQDTFAYSGSDDIDKVAWYSANSLLNGIKRTHPVAGKQPNALGLFDMSGNVWEWCWDWYGDYPAGPAQNWRGPDKGQSRVLRGGSWYDIGYGSRVSRRYYYDPGGRYDDLGFRLSQGY